MAARTKIALLTLCLILGWVGWTGLNALFRVHPSAADWGGSTVSPEGQDMSPKNKFKKTDSEWKSALTPEQYKVMIQCGTEPPFSGKYNDFWQKGTYFCAACGTALFDSETKYDHGTGWPSFTSAVSGPAIEYKDDFSLATHRVEVRCATCGAHLGHVFDDGPGPDRKHYCINSAALAFKPFAAAAATRKRSASGLTETAVFAAGCFWGVEYKFEQVAGVLETEVGYTGGLTTNPSYKDVCTDATGHAEAVRVTFDPSQIAYEDLVRKFFSFHDPTQLNRQGPDVGTQYRSAIFYRNKDQKRIAETVKAEVERSGALRGKVATAIVPTSMFFRAEEYHQKYYDKNKIKSCGI